MVFLVHMIMYVYNKFNIYIFWFINFIYYFVLIMRSNIEARTEK